MTNVHENWLPIPNYEGLYEISDLGNVKSLPKKYSHNGIILNPSTDKNGYFRVDLWKNKVNKTIKVHRLVMLAFIGYSELAIDHIDGDKRNNKLSNLRYCSNRQNSCFYYENKDSSSKYVGVNFNKQNNKWKSYIVINKKQKHLGYFETEDEAYEKLISFKKEMNII
jgi:uncharacterized membrane protein